MIEDKIGKRLQEIRRSRKLTQEALAEMIGLSPNYISAVERGINQLSYGKLVDALNCLGCSADDVFCDVVDHSTKSRCSKLAEQLEALPREERNKILAVLEILIPKFDE